jgi:hypothetical protein
MLLLLHRVGCILSLFDIFLFIFLDYFGSRLRSTVSFRLVLLLLLNIIAWPLSRLLLFELLLLVNDVVYVCNIVDVVIIIIILSSRLN